MPATWVSAAVGVAGLLGGDGGGGGGGGGEAQAMQTMIQMQQLQMAKDQWQRYLDTYGPIEDQFIAEARDAGSIANQNKAAGQAEAANKAAFATARERLAKSPGMNPSDQAYLQEQNRINLAEAAGSATAQNDARNKVVDRGVARMTDAVSLGKGMPATANSAIAGAANTGNGIMNAAYRQDNLNAERDAAGMGQFGKAVGGLFQSKTFQNWLNNSGNDMAGFSGLSGNSNYAGITSGSQSVPFGDVVGVAD